MVGCEVHLSPHEHSRRNQCCIYSRVTRQIRQCSWEDLSHRPPYPQHSREVWCRQQHCSSTPGPLCEVPRLYDPLHPRARDRRIPARRLASLLRVPELRPRFLPGCPGESQRQGSRQDHPPQNPGFVAGQGSIWCNRGCVDRLAHKHLACKAKRAGWPAAIRSHFQNDHKGGRHVVEGEVNTRVQSRSQKTAFLPNRQ